MVQHLFGKIPSHLFQPTSLLPIQSNISIHLPHSNSDTLKFNGNALIGGNEKNIPRKFFDQLNGRDYLIQGELLRGFVFVLSPVIRNIPKYGSQQGKESEDSGKSEERNEDKSMQMGEHLRLIEFYKCFSDCSFNIDFIPAKEMDNKEGESTHTFLRPAVVNNTPTSPNPLKNSLKLSSKTHGENLFGMEKCEKNLLSVEEMLRHPNFFQFDDGNFFFVYEIEYPVSVGNYVLNQSSKLKLSIVSPSYSVRKGVSEREEFQRILNPFYMENESRSVESVLDVRVIQPFQVKFDTLNIGNSFLITANIQNNCKEVKLKLDDVDLYLFDLSQDPTNRRLFSSYNLDGQFKITVPEDDLPTELAYGDEQSMVFIVEPVVTNQVMQQKDSGFFSETAKPASRIIFAWHVEETWGKVVSNYDIPVEPLVHPASNDLMITIQSVSPAPLYKEFDICVTISNLGEKTRDLTLLMDPSDEEDRLESEDQPTVPSASTESSITPCAIQRMKTANQPPILCLQKSVTLGNLKPKMTASAFIPYIAVREGLFDLDHIAVHDSKTDVYFAVKNRCQIYVQDRL